MREFSLLSACNYACAWKPLLIIVMCGLDRLFMSGRVMSGSLPFDKEGPGKAPRRGGPLQRCD